MNNDTKPKRITKISKSPDNSLVKGESPKKSTNLVKVDRTKTTYSKNKGSDYSKYIHFIITETKFFQPLTLELKKANHQIIQMVLTSVPQIINIRLSISLHLQRKS